METKKWSKTKRTLVGDPDWRPQISLTATSENFQPSGRGLKMIVNARKEDTGWNKAEFSKSPEAKKIFEENPKLREQIKACTTSQCMIADINDPQYEELYTLIRTVLANGKEHHSACHLTRTVLANSKEYHSALQLHKVRLLICWELKPYEQHLLSDAIPKKVQNTRT